VPCVKTVIDWSKKPAPWCWIGPSFAAEVRDICGVDYKQPPGELPDQNGAALLGRRLKLKITQHELARMTGISQTTINRLEHGNMTVTRLTWDRIEAVFDALEAGCAVP